MDKRNNLLQSETVKPTTVKIFVKHIIKALEDFESGKIGFCAVYGTQFFISRLEIIPISFSFIMPQHELDIL